MEHVGNNAIGAHSALSPTEVLALVGDGVIGISADGRILLFNRAAEEIFGYAADEVLGQPVEILIPEPLRQAHNAQVRQFAAGLGPTRRTMGKRREVLGQRKNGERFPLEATLSRHGIGDRTILTVSVRDITERKQAEADLRASEE
jgi:PAS domain S-box-containing protein